MFRRLLPFLAILAVPLLAPLPVAAEPPATAEPPAAGEPSVHAEGDPLPVPPGTPADQAIWKATRDVSSTVTQTRYLANKMQWQVKTNDLFGRLDKAAEASPAEAARLKDIRARLAKARDANLAIYSGRWPVDTTRVCQYTLVELSSAMYEADGRGNTPSLNEARDRAVSCTRAAQGAADALRATNETFAAAIAEAEKAVPPIQPVTPAKPAGK